MRRIVRALVAAAGALVLVATALAPSASAATDIWWNGSWSHRLNVKVETADALPGGYALRLTFDHAAMTSAGTSLASGDDIRIVYWNGSAWTQLDRVLAHGSAWNSAATAIHFRTVSAIGASTEETNYYLYHANPAAGAPPANPSNVYDLHDDFEDGSIDTGKWTINQMSGLSATETGGQLRLTGTTDAANAHNHVGVTTKTSFAAGWIAESTFSMTSMDAAGENNWKARFGLTSGDMQIHATSTVEKATVTYTTSWIRVPGESSTAFDVLPFGPQRAMNGFSADGTATFWENGTNVATRAGLATSARTLSFGFSPDTVNGGVSFDTRFDDILVRKYVTNEPSVELVTNAAVITGTIPVSLTFTVSPSSGSCNGIAQTAGTAVTGTAVSLGRIGPGTNGVAAQDITIASNAGDGFTVSLRSTGGLGTLDDVPGTNAAPLDFPSSGSEAFGYTTSDASLGTGTPNRFTGAGAKWAALTTSPAEISFSLNASAGETVCVAFQAAASTGTAAGSHSTTVIYSAVPLF